MTMTTMTTIITVNDMMVCSGLLGRMSTQKRNIWEAGYVWKATLKLQQKI
jgi:hypothetical protein